MIGFIAEQHYIIILNSRNKKANDISVLHMIVKGSRIQPAPLNTLPRKHDPIIRRINIITISIIYIAVIILPLTSFLYR